MENLVKVAPNVLPKLLAPNELKFYLLTQVEERSIKELSEGVGAIIKKRQEGKKNPQPTQVDGLELAEIKIREVLNKAYNLIGIPSVNRPNQETSKLIAQQVIIIYGDLKVSDILRAFNYPIIGTYHLTYGHFGELIGWAYVHKFLKAYSGYKKRMLGSSDQKIKIYLLDQNTDHVGDFISRRISDSKYLGTMLIDAFKSVLDDNYNYELHGVNHYNYLKDLDIIQLTPAAKDVFKLQSRVSQISDTRKRFGTAVKVIGGVRESTAAMKRKKLQFQYLIKEIAGSGMTLDQFTDIVKNGICYIGIKGHNELTQIFNKKNK